MPNLAVSLHATTDEQRTALVPPNRKYPLADILDACRRFPLKRRSRITFEYVLLDGVNDTPEDARRLARLLAGLRSKVNLIPLNPAPGIPFNRPSDARVDRFAQILADHHLTVSVRKSRGQDIRAACGQLIVEGGTRRTAAQQLALLAEVGNRLYRGLQPATRRAVRRRVTHNSPQAALRRRSARAPTHSAAPADRACSFKIIRRHRRPAIVYGERTTDRANLRRDGSLRHGSCLMSRIARARARTSAPSTLPDMTVASAPGVRVRKHVQMRQRQSIPESSRLVRSALPSRQGSRR